MLLSLFNWTFCLDCYFFNISPFFIQTELLFLGDTCSNHYLSPIHVYHYVFPLLKIKKCGEMARKLRFFKEQMMKAGLTPSIKSVSQTDTNTDDLEVCWIFLSRISGFIDMCVYMLNLSLFFYDWLDKTWRTWGRAGWN